LFSPDTEHNLDAYVTAHEDEIVGATNSILVDFKQLESVHSPGHDYAHLMDVVNSALRIFGEYGNLSKSEKLEIIYACMTHDLGRSIEDDLDSVDKKKTEFVAPAFIGRHLLRKQGLKLPDDLQTRIMYDIASAPIPKTSHRTADTVHQCDREQLIGSATISRGLAFDSILKGRELPIPFDPNLRLKLPMPESPEDTSWLIQYEFFMRNVYPATSPDGIAAGNKTKRENCVILMLALEGKEEEYKQVFGPELGLVTAADNPHWNKKAIPKEVYESAMHEKEEFLKDPTLAMYRPGSEAQLALDLMSDENTASPDNSAEILQKRLEKCTERERQNFWNVLTYAKQQLHKRRAESLQALRSIPGDDKIGAMAARWIIEEYEERERKSRAEGGR
jgi:HD superfamily phosphodiesterase